MNDISSVALFKALCNSRYDYLHISQGKIICAFNQCHQIFALKVLSQDHQFAFALEHGLELADMLSSHQLSQDRQLPFHNEKRSIKGNHLGCKQFPTLLASGFENLSR